MEQKSTLNRFAGIPFRKTSNKPVSHPYLQSSGEGDSGALLVLHSSSSSSRAPDEALDTTATSGSWEDSHGLEVLYTPESPTIDVIFIHGLTGRQISTWTAEGAADPWPKVLLPGDIPKARISAFGYDADVAHWLAPAGQNRIRHHARNLLAAISDMRFEADTEDLPIIFVAHSLGGLVCENALITALNAEEHQHRILECTKGIVFLGTPHRGSDMANWATIAGNMANLLKKTNVDIVDVLRPDSEVLEIITQEFHTMLRSRERTSKTEIRIECFGEELPVVRAGKSFLVVPHKSATLERYPAQTIHADHIGLTKFSDKNNKEYKKIAICLRRWIRDIERSVPQTRLDDELLLSTLRIDHSPGRSPARSPARSPGQHSRNHSLSEHEPIYGVQVLLSTYFTARIQEKQAIKNKVEARNPISCSRYVIFGMPGIGKTQLALSYAEQAFGNGSFRHVFFVNASSFNQFINDYGHISLFAGWVNDHRTIDQEACKISKDLLESSGSTSSRWLLILDNLNHDVLLQCMSLLPRNTAGGLTIATTQNMNVARFLGSTHDRDTILELGALTTADATNMFMSCAWLHRDVISSKTLSEIEQLVTGLGCLPQAIEDVGTYIRETTFSIKYALDLVNRRQTIQLLQSTPKAVTKGFLAHRSILTSLSRLSDSARQLLSICAFLSPANIPDQFWQCLITTPRHGQQVASSIEDITTGKALQELRDLSLISIQSLNGQRMFGVNVIVQVACREYLNDTGLSIYWLKRSMLAMTESHDANLDPRSPMTWQAYDVILEHYGELSQHARNLAGYNKEFSRLTSIIIQYILARGWYNRAHEMMAVYTYHTSVEVIDFAAIESMNDHAMALYYNGKRKEAVDLLRRAFKAESARPEGIYSPKTTLNLARFLLYMGQMSQAIEIVGQSKFQALGALFSDDDYWTSQWTFTIAILRLQQDKHLEAEVLLQQFNRTRRKALGDDHLDVVSAAYHLALVAYDQQDHYKARGMLEPLIQENIQFLGSAHPQILEAQTALIEIYCELDQLSQANQLADFLVETCQNTYGHEHPLTFASRSGKGLIMREQHLALRASSYLGETLTIAAQQLGDCDPIVMQIRARLAICALNTDDFKSAELHILKQIPLLEREVGSTALDTMGFKALLSLVYCETSRGAEGEITMKHLLNQVKKYHNASVHIVLMYQQLLALVYSSCGKYKEAEAETRLVLQTREALLGKEHPASQVSSRMLALMLLKQHRYPEAESLFEELLAVSRRLHEEDHSVVLSILSLLAQSYSISQSTQKAISMREELLRLQAKAMPGENITLDNMRLLALLYHSESRLDDTERLLAQTITMEALRTDRKYAHGLCLNIRGLVYSSQGKLEEARDSTASSLKLLQESVGLEHPEALRVMINYAVDTLALNRYEELETICQTLIQLCTSVLGQDNDQTLTVKETLALAYERQEKNEKWNELRSQILASRRRRNDGDPLVLIKSLSDATMSKVACGQFQAALDLSREILTLQTIQFGEDHESIFGVLDDIVVLCDALGLRAESQQMLDKMDKIYQDNRQECGPIYVVTLERSSEQLWQEKFYTDAISNRTKAVKIRMIIQEIDEAVLESLETLSAWNKEQKRWTAAEINEESIIDIRKKLYGEKDTATLEAMFNLAMSYESRKKLDKALVLMKRVERCREQSLGIDHSHTVTCVVWIACIQHQQGHREEALALVLDTLHRSIKLFGLNDSVTAACRGYVEDWQV